MIAALLLAGLMGGIFDPPPIAPVSASKTVAVVSDPLNGVLTPKAIPGAALDYTITVSNTSNRVLDDGALAVADLVPTKTKLYVKDLGLTGSGPVAFAGNLFSGVSFTFSSLASTADDVAFSKDGGLTYTYVPIPDADGCDAQVTHLRVSPRGALSTTGVFTVRFRVVVR
jgi:uncharacterized repeat protein (TIGR01451 family)